jgi:AcrR family transcriptional regulator
MVRTKKDFAVKRGELLARIWDIFLANGYEFTTLALIRKELSLSKGVFYHYFDSKEECADLAVERYVQLGVDHLRGMELSGMGAERKLVLLMLASVQFFNPPGEQTEQINASANAVLHQKLMIAITKQLAPVYAEVIAQGVTEGVLNTRYPLEAAEMILTLANLYLDRELFAWSPEAMPHKIQALADAMEKLLGASKGCFEFIYELTKMGERA